MTQEVKYKGYTAQPSDYESTDGELSLSLGLIQEDGALKPIMPPSVEMMPTEKIIYIHEVQGEKNYITSGADLGWIKGIDESVHDFTHSFSGVEVYQVTSIGNTLIVLTSEGSHYILWKKENSNYTYLGTKIPECTLSFGLKGDRVKSEETYYGEVENYATSKINIASTLNYQSNGIIKLNTDDYKPVSDFAFGLINNFIDSESLKKGKFMFPFLVRYAYRMYDGTLLMHSAPILMIPATRQNPWLSSKYSFTDNSKTYLKAIYSTVYGYAYDLNYQLMKDIKSELSQWSDIVKSVDIFISNSIYQYFPDKNIEYLSAYPSDNFLVADALPKNTATGERLGYVKCGLSGYTGNSAQLIPVLKTVEEIFDEIKNCSNFYFLTSISIDNLSTTRKKIDLPREYLYSIVSRERMTDDYNSHNTTIAQYGFVYNSRLNLCNLEYRLFDGYNPAAMLAYTEGRVTDVIEGTVELYNPQYKAYAYVYIDSNNGEQIVSSEEFMYHAYDNGMWYYLYYPDVNAKKIVLHIEEKLSDHLTFRTELTFSLTPHPFLNGAVCITNNPAMSYPGERPVTSYNNVKISNKIYSSEVNNPFLFPATGINTIGLGKVNAICASAKALSEGQFGQFPLYAFTSDGVWALEVSDTGTYSAKQPITREVCTNVDSITQIDTAVLFATNRGIMLLSGSTCVCISDSIKDLKPFTLSRLPSSTAIIDTFNSKVNRMDELRDTDVEMLPFLDFIKDDCRMVYDYTNQHIVVYKPDYYYAYVYSMKSKQWGMMRCDFESNVNSYPESLVMGYVKRLRQVRPGVSHIIRIRALLNLSIADSVYIPDEDGYIMFPFGALLVTRPFDFEQPDVFKTIDTIIQRGNFPRDKVQQVLYGSNDLQHWFPIWSSVDKYMRGFRGTPYKAFRLAVIAQLEQHEDIDGFSVQFTPRLTNQLR